MSILGSVSKEKGSAARVKKKKKKKVQRRRCSAVERTRHIQEQQGGVPGMAGARADAVDHPRESIFYRKAVILALAENGMGSGRIK